MKRFVLLTLMASILLMGCSSSPDIDYDKAVSFSDIKSYSVKRPTNGQDELSTTLVVNSIEKNLSTKGLNKAESSQSDISVGFYAQTSYEPNRKSFSIGLGTGIGGRSGGISLGSIFSLPIGKQSTLYQSLRIDIFQGGTIIWSGIDEIKIESGNSLELQNKIDELVSNILTSFPPAP